MENLFWVPCHLALGLHQLSYSTLIALGDQSAVLLVLYSPSVVSRLANKSGTWAFLAARLSSMIPTKEVAVLTF